ncbi:MAG: MFS transporter [Chloroflexi bacterium]|nr:MFS transporter [Chloroflexota bacterium]
MAVREAADNGAVLPTAAQPASSPAAPTGEVTLKTRRGQVVLASFTTAHFSHHVSNSLLNPLLPFIRDAFALSYDQSGWLVSAFSLSLGISNAPIGVLADRFGSRLVIVVGLLLTGLVSAAIAFSGSYWQLFGLLIVLGLIAGSYHAPASALMSRIFPASVRGSAIGLHTTGGHLSFFIVPATAGWLVTQTGAWTTPYLWLSFAPVLAGLWLWTVAPGHHQRPAGKTDRLAVFRELGVVVRTVGPLVSASIAFQVVFAALLAFMTLYLVDVRGIEPAWAAVLFGVPQLVGLIGSPLGGLLSDRIGRRGVILIALGLMGPSLWGITTLPTELLVIPLTGVGIAAAMRLTCTEVLVMDSAPAHRRATALGAYHMLVQQSGGIAAPALGILAASIGIGPAFGGVCAALGLASIAVVVFSRKL